MSSTFKKLLGIIPPNIKKKSIYVLSLSMLSTIFDIILLICVIPLIRFLQEPSREVEIFQEFMSSFSPSSIGAIEGLGIQEFAFFMILIALASSLTKLFFYKNSAYLSAEASNIIINSFFTSKLNSRKAILEKDIKSSFFSMLHKIDIISNTYFILLSASASIILILATTILLLFINPFITFIVISVTFIFYVLIYFTTNSSINNASNLINVNADMRSKAILNSLSSIREAILYNKVSYFIDEVTAKDQLFRNSRAKIQFFGQLPRAIFESITIIIILSLCLLVSESSQQDTMNLLPTLGAFLLAFQRMLPQFQTIYGAYNEYIGASEIIVSFHKTKNTQEKILDTKRKDKNNLNKPLKYISEFKELHLKDITFKYPGALDNTLNNLNLVVKKNSKIAIVGPSGMGKSTLVDLMIGLHQPDSGKILIDGEEISEHNLNSYRTLFSYVPQRIGILNKSIIDNITLRKKNKHLKQEVLDAIYMSKLYSKDKKFDLNEEIGEGGESMSGGQAQRLAIARMYFFSRKIIIFDESTSSLNKEIEREILEGMASNDDITFIHITHKLNKKYYDEVYELTPNGLNKKLN